jgi:hypothetical protein
MDKNAFLIELSESERSMFGKVDFTEQPRPQQVFSAIYELEGRVNMSGFEAYFSNVEPEEISFAPEALREVGAANAAAIVQRAVDLVGPLPSDADELESLLDSRSAELEALDAEFMAYPDDLTELLYAFVEKNSEHFA